MVVDTLSLPGYGHYALDEVENVTNLPERDDIQGELSQQLLNHFHR
jgi:hypothetical protein